ncbi:MAG: tripartite tricarboxylate transporter substrate-binding protein [Burkholderiales bacterium]
MFRSFNAFAQRRVVFAAAALAAAGAAPQALAAWEPTKPIEFVVPAGTGGGADQMARLIQGIVTKYSLTKQPLVVVNKAGGAGAEGFLDVTQKSSGDPHKIIITLSNLFTTPLATGTPFNWKEMTPVSMMALDQFVLWVNAEKPYKTTKEFIEAAKAVSGDPQKRLKMGGTGSKQEDQIITVGLEKATGTKFTYVPFKGGGEVAVQLVGNHIDSTVNNPIEAVAQWRAGQLRPLCVFDDERMPYMQKITETQSWNDIPTCKEAGVNLDYVMLRGIFMPGGVSAEQLAYFQALMKKVRETAEWKEFMDKGAFNQTAMAGEEYKAWLTKAESTHKQLMEEAGFIAK